MERRSPPSATVRRPPGVLEQADIVSSLSPSLSFTVVDPLNVLRICCTTHSASIMASETSVRPFHICEQLLTSPSKTSFGDSLYMFFALYLTTFFSLDTWAAARNSPYRAPGNNSFYRPASTPPAPDSYQGGMHGRGNAGPRNGSGGNGGNVGRVPQARDSRPPMKLYGTAACGACMT